MPSQPRPQSDWLRSFILFSILTCVFVAVLAIFGVFVVRRVMRHFTAPAPVQTSLRDVRPDVRLPAVTAGWDNVTTNLLSAFDQADVIALGERLGKKMDSELQLRLIRDPDLPFRAHFIVVEFGNSLYQAILDKYIYGEDVPMAAVEKVWCCDSPAWAGFYAAVREVNRKLPPARRLRVIAGDVPIDWDNVKTKADLVPFLLRRTFPVSPGRVAVPRGEKALVIYDGAHVRRPAFPLWAAAAESNVEDHSDAPLPPETAPMFKALQVSGPGRVFVVKTIAGVNPFEDALPVRELPVLVPLTGLRAAVGSGLGDDADACVYFGNTPEALASDLPDPAVYRRTPDGQEAERRRKIMEEK